MLKNLAFGVVVGYAQKVVQVLCSLALIPFLLSDKVFGFGGFGVLSVLLAAVGFLSSLLDGWRLSTGRRFGKAESNSERVYSVLAVISVALSAPFVILIIFCGAGVLGYFGVAEVSDRLLLLLAGFFLLDQVNSLSEQCLHAGQKSWLVNLSILTEVSLRTILLFFILSQQPTMDAYFSVFVTFMSLKFAYYSAVLIANKKVALGVNWAQIKLEFAVLSESLPLSIKAVSVYSVFRLTILLVNKFISQEMAGIYSLLMVTIRGYITQLFVSVIRPMVVPVVSGIDLQKVNDDKKQLFKMMVGTYSYLVLLSCVVLALSAPIWLPIWIGAGMNNYIALFVVGIIVLGLDAQAAVKALLLVSQGRGVVLAKVTMMAVALYAIYIALSILVLDRLSINIIVAGVFGFIILNTGIVIPYLFNKYMIKSSSFSAFKGTFLILVFCLVSYFFAGFLGSKTSTAVWPFVILMPVFIASYTLFEFNPFNKRPILNTFKRIVGY